MAEAEPVSINDATEKLESTETTLQTQTTDQTVQEDATQTAEAQDLETAGTQTNVDEPPPDPKFPFVNPQDVPPWVLDRQMMEMKDVVEKLKKQIVEDERIDSIYRSKHNLTERFDNRTVLHPHGMAEFDSMAIPGMRKIKFEQYKLRTRHENYRYLGKHQELDAILSLFLKKLLNAKPQDAVHFAAEFFTHDILDPNFEEYLEIEQHNLSNYRVTKMRTEEKVTTLGVGMQGLRARKLEKGKKDIETHFERCFKKRRDRKCAAGRPIKIDQLEVESTEVQEDSLNSLKKLNIGPLAHDFDKTALKAKSKTVAPTTPPLAKPQKKEPVYRRKEKEKPQTTEKHYCGCKDPGRREIAHPRPRQSNPEPEQAEQPEPQEE